MPKMFKVMIPAEVTGIQKHYTPRGERIYALFRTAEGLILAIWAPADHDLLSQLHTGDVVHFDQRNSGHFHILSKTN